MEPGILVVLNDCVPEGREAYERWYVEEHLYERVGVPGFRFGRRYEALQGSPPFFTYYEVDSPAVLHSPVYVERIQNPTPRTTAVMPGFREMSRTVCRKTGHPGLRMLGGIVLVLRFDEGAGAAPDPDALQAAAQAVQEHPDVLGAQVWEAEPDPEPDRPLTREETLRGKRDARIAAALVVDLMRPEAGESLLRGPAVSALAAAPGAAVGLYRLLCDLHEADLHREEVTP